MDLGIGGRTAIVTGGARGIGRETAKKLLEAGARVTICARTQATLEQARDELSAKTGGDVLAVVADMAVAPDIERLARASRDRFGPADILEEAGVPCAPIQDLREMLAEPQTEAMGLLQHVPGLDLDLMSLPVSFDGRRPPVRRRAPTLGEHTKDIVDLPPATG